MLALLCGPPCAGKTTLAHHLAGPMLDYDDLARALGSPVQWQHPEPYRTMAEQVMRQRMVGMTEGIIIRTAPKPTDRASWAHRLGVTVYVLDPGYGECLRRAKAAHRPAATARSIAGWYRAYRPWEGDHPARDLVSADPAVTIRDPGG